MIDIMPFALFALVFVMVVGIIGLSVVVIFVRLLRKPRETQPPKGASVIREREVIRQIVKIRCPYCGKLYDETYDNCPHCGGKKQT